MRGIQRLEIREGRNRGVERKVTGHKPSSVAEIVLYASVRARMRVYVHALARARALVYLLPDPRTVHA